MRTIKEILTDFISVFVANEAFYAQRARVVSVDEVNMVCVVRTVTDKSILTNVKISSYLSANLGVFIVPMVNSVVIVDFTGKNDAFIAKTSAIERVLIVTEEISIEVTDENIIFNGGENGGLVLINDLTTALNNLVTEISNMVTVFNAHVHPSVGSPTGTPQTAPSNFTAGDYENDKISQ